MTTRPPVPPFSKDRAIPKTRLAEDGWNSRDPEKVAQVYTSLHQRSSDQGVRPQIAVALIKAPTPEKLAHKGVRSTYRVLSATRHRGKGFPASFALNTLSADGSRGAQSTQAGLIKWRI